MELIYREMPRNYDLAQTGDFHLGPDCCFKQGIKEMVQQVKERKNCFLWFDGDAVDAILPSDKRYAHSTMDREKWLMTPQQQADEVVKLMWPIRKKILGWQLGNHEYTVINTFDIAGYIADKLGVPWAGVMAKFVATRKGKAMHRFLFTHGRGSLNSQAKDPIQGEANRKAKLKLNLQKTGHADCIYMGCGHHHQMLVVEPTVDKEVVLSDDGEDLVQKYRGFSKQSAKYIPPECRWYGCSPGFLKTYGKPGRRVITYSEMNMYPPTQLGWLELKVRDGKLVKVKEVDAP